jgi:uncharacterized protein (TIGR00369 family)
MSGETATSPEPPEGFVVMTGRGEFSTRNGPYYVREAAEEGVQQAFYASPHHCNGFGIVHGGMLAAFLDGLLAHSVGKGAGRPSVTIQLSINYLSIARKGEWVIGEARLTRATREVAFAEARLHAGGRDVVRATGVFKLMNERPRAER